MTRISGDEIAGRKIGIGTGIPTWAETLVSLVPGVAVFVTAAGLGSFHGSASFLGLAGLCLLVLGLAASSSLRGGAEWLDPLRLGRWGSLAVAVFLALLVASWIVSPVSRAGRTALILAPAFLLLPAVFAHCWHRKEAVQRGLLGISGAVLAIGLWAVLDLALGPGPRAAMPLGHHRLLASWLVCLLPLACLGALRPGLPWPRLSRVFAVAAGLLGTAAVLLSKSLLGSVALAIEIVALVAFLWFRKRPARRRGASLAVVVIVLGAALLNLGRLKDLVSMEDSSLLARSVYWQAGLAGLAERPWLGWGPGATPWTLASFLHPRPGLNPPGELVGDLHNLPLNLAYELGWPACLLVMGGAILFWWRRWVFAFPRRAPWKKAPSQAEEEAEEKALSGIPAAELHQNVVVAALLGVGAFAVSSLGGAPLGVGALPVALAAAAGAALAGEARSVHRRSSYRWAPALYSIVAVVLLLAPLRAHHAYEKAQAEDDLRLLRAAVALDPDFPLYQERLAIAEGDLLQAWQAASATPGVAGHWLVAGALATDTQPSIAGGFLGEACRLDPLGAAAPFLMLTAEPGSVDAPQWGARALLAEPRLLASPWWRGREDLLERTVDAIQRVDGVDAGWRLSLKAQAEAVREYAAAADQDPSSQDPSSQDPVETVRLAVIADGRSGVAFSLHLFRRLPWPQELVAFDLEVDALKRIDLPAATILASTAAEVFQASGCGLGENSALPGS